MKTIGQCFIFCEDNCTGAHVDNFTSVDNFTIPLFFSDYSVIGSLLSLVFVVKMEISKPTELDFYRHLVSSSIAFLTSLTIVILILQ